MTAKIARFPAAKARERKKEIGIIGSEARASQAMKAATRSPPASSIPITSGLPQPAEFPRTNPQTIPKAPAEIRPRPRRSSALSGPEALTMRDWTSGAAITPIGTLSQKIQLQSSP